MAPRCAVDRSPLVPIGLLLVLAACSGPSSVGVTDDSAAPPSTSDDPTLLTGTPEDDAPAPLRVNELLARNEDGVENPAGGWTDWIELYNPTAEAVILDDWSLADRLDPESAHPLDTLSVPAGGFLLLWADDAPELGPEHLGFSLAEEGEAVALYGPGPTAVDGLRFGAMAPDVALARDTDGGEGWRLTPAPTPGASNGDAP